MFKIRIRFLQLALSSKKNNIGLIYHPLDKCNSIGVRLEVKYFHITPLLIYNFNFCVVSLVAKGGQYYRYQSKVSIPVWFDR
jgi:hypothetical protein